jgi:hypothetical protein
MRHTLLILYLFVVGLSAASMAGAIAASVDGRLGSLDREGVDNLSGEAPTALLAWPEVGAGLQSGALRALTSRQTTAFDDGAKRWMPIPARTPILGIRQGCTGWLNSFTIVQMKGLRSLHIRTSDIHILDATSQDEHVTMGVKPCAPPHSLRWEDVKAAHDSGLVHAILPRGTKAFDRHANAWFEVPDRTELVTLNERCAGWMQAFIQGAYGERPSVYVREWDVHVMDRSTRIDLFERLEQCQRPKFSRALLVAGQREGVVQVFTNKAVPANGENGAQVYVGPTFKNRQDFEIEWLSHSTSGLLKIPANREVVLENESCKPIAQVKIRYAERTFRISASHLDIRIAGDNLAKTPLGPAFLFLCDDM